MAHLRWFSHPLTTTPNQQPTHPPTPARDLSSASMVRKVGRSRRVTANLKTSVRELREARHLFQLFMDNSPALAYMKDEQGKYVYYNRTVEKRLNFGKAMLGKSDDLFPEEVA